MNRLGLSKSEPEPIMVVEDMKASCKNAEPDAWRIETDDSQKRITRDMEDYSRAQFGTNALAWYGRMVWCENGSIYTEKGIPFIPTDVDIELPLDDEMPKMFNKSIIPEYRRWQVPR